jgi:carbonic anhydrase/acetyltransferase-like protein (isoleucine patch superfamily)
MLFEINGNKPEVGSGSYIASSAEIIGNVTIGDGCYIGSGAKIIADYGKVKIGSRTAIEENVIIHTRPDQETVIGDEVTVGHGAILHTCTIGNFALIGMGAIVSDYSTIGEWAAVGEGAVVISRSNIPARKVALGVPAKPVKDISEEWQKLWAMYKASNAEVARHFSTSLREVKTSRSRNAQRIRTTTKKNHFD